MRRRYEIIYGGIHSMAHRYMNYAATAVTETQDHESGQQVPSVGGEAVPT